MFSIRVLLQRQGQETALVLGERHEWLWIRGLDSLVERVHSLIPDAVASYKYTLQCMTPETWVASGIVGLAVQQCTPVSWTGEP
jgi:hypothetical protein